MPAEYSLAKLANLQLSTTKVHERLRIEEELIPNHSPHEQPKVYSPSFMNLAVNIKGEREREGVKRRGGFKTF